MRSVIPCVEAPAPTHANTRSPWSLSAASFAAVWPSPVEAMNWTTTARTASAWGELVDQFVQVGVLMRGAHVVQRRSQDRLPGLCY